MKKILTDEEKEKAGILALEKTIRDSKENLKIYEDARGAAEIVNKMKVMIVAMEKDLLRYIEEVEAGLEKI